MNINDMMGGTWDGVDLCMLDEVTSELIAHLKEVFR